MHVDRNNKKKIYKTDQKTLIFFSARTEAYTRDWGIFSCKLP